MNQEASNIYVAQRAKPVRKATVKYLERHRDVIIKLYQGNSLKVVMEKLEEEYGLRAT